MGTIRSPFSLVVNNKYEERRGESVNTIRCYAVYYPYYFSVSHPLFFIEVGTMNESTSV